MINCCFGTKTFLLSLEKENIMKWKIAETVKVFGPVGDFLKRLFIQVIRTSWLRSDSVLVKAWHLSSSVLGRGLAIFCEWP